MSSRRTSERSLLLLPLLIIIDMKIMCGMCNCNQFKYLCTCNRIAGENPDGFSRRHIMMMMQHNYSLQWRTMQFIRMSICTVSVDRLLSCSHFVQTLKLLHDWFLSLSLSLYLCAEEDKSERGGEGRTKRLFDVCFAYCDSSIYYRHVAIWWSDD